MIGGKRLTIIKHSILTLQAGISAFHRISGAALFESAQSSFISSKQQSTN
jgi:flagellar assembly factor FliW